MDVPDDQPQLRAALKTQAALELRSAPPADQALIAYQALLQDTAPLDVVVPFADELASYLGRQPASSRVTRDFARLRALIKAVTALRFAQRRRDEKGRLMAEIEDYAAVYDLLADVYEASTGGAGKKVREVVEAVAALQRDGAPQPVRVSDIARELGLTKMAAKRRVDAAIRGGWLYNAAEKGRPADLRIGATHCPRTSASPARSAYTGGVPAGHGDYGSRE